MFGIPCSEASQRAYLKHNSETTKSFRRLQQLDKGTVEHRTIAFSTHLVVSRWEPAEVSTSAAVASVSTSLKTSSSASSPSRSPSKSTFAEEDSKQQPQSQPKNNHDPSQAARLMSVANYMRHIISLASGKSLLHSPSVSVQKRLTIVQQQQQQQLMCQEYQKRLQGYRTGSDITSHDGTSTPSTKPGPIKSSASFSSRKHRYGSEYHDHNMRRQHHHLQQQQQQTKQYQTTVQFPPLLSIPFPNLTLTLALIYVDRLKAKYPEARGESGCSHRLFLVAYIIAAKYRCSVELMALQDEYLSQLREEDRDTDENSPSKLGGIEKVQATRASENTPITTIMTTEERLSEARSRAELILSNHEWVRLLNLGSFFRPLNPVSTTNKVTTTPIKRDVTISTVRTSPTQPTVRSPSNDTSPGSARPEPKSLPIQSEPRTASSFSTSSSPGDTRNDAKVDEIKSAAAAAATVAPQSPAPSHTTILQVEDLDRMEAEFLTFLGFDLSTRGQDLDTCWNLLVGNKGA
ncbi:hypothetical protein BGX28_001448 [Mortierella sp. GBA30]|nr:hypothetical protein BGX28_001448 [Mortierella sp. GBA30]